MDKVNMTIDDHVFSTESWTEYWYFKRLPYTFEEKEQIYAIEKGFGLKPWV